jgi:hypothetical protein
MKPFHTIAVPHKDILDGKLTMDVFAADLWEVSQDRGPDEYRDSETFFRKTYETEGLQNILTVVHKRLQGKGGDAVIQLQTPFGGGKTHALIALYHKAKEWGANTVVIVGTALDPRKTLWGMIEEQLTGTISKMSEKTAYGKGVLKEVIEGHEPVLVLIDEALEYMTKAAGVTVADSTLAAQTSAFMQELTELAGSMKGLCVVVTLPSSAIEHYDAQAERLFQQLQKVSGRVEKVYTPVQDSEITSVIRARLFSEVNENDVKEVVAKFVDYADQEGILPKDLQPSEYRDRFIDSYPFMPEVVDMLYHRWGSFPTFQRTRGVLRLLSLVVSNIGKSKEPYISPGDFNLGIQDIRHELLKHIGQEYNGVIDADISGKDSNSKRVDKEMGRSYVGLGFGVRASTSIFLHSFSGGRERGITTLDIKRCASIIDQPSAAVAEAVDKLESNLFFLQSTANKHFFSNQPNINRIILTIMDNVSDEEVGENEKELLEDSMDGGPLRVFLWEEETSNIPDSVDLKLVVLRRKDKRVIDAILKIKGQTPRVYRNAIFFLYPSEDERLGFTDSIKHIIAHQRLIEDKTQNLSDEQRTNVKRELDKRTKRRTEAIQRLYRRLAVPVKDGISELDLGIPTPGDKTGFARRVYEKLSLENEILEKIAPLVLQKKYLENQDYVLTEQIYESSLRTPGEPRPINRTVFEHSIEEGVSAGLFGLGAMVDKRPVCFYFEQSASVALAENEVLMRKELCIIQQQQVVVDTTQDTFVSLETELDSDVVRSESADVLHTGEDRIDNLRLRFRLPSGKLSDILSVIRFLQTKFKATEVELLLEEGSMSERDYEDKIEEAFRQMGINLERE